MACFVMARCPLQIAVALGLVGGLAGGVLSQWWMLAKNPETPTSRDSNVAMPKALERFTTQLKRFGLQSREEQKRKRKPPRIGLFGGVRPRR